MQELMRVAKASDGVNLMSKKAMWRIPTWSRLPNRGMRPGAIIKAEGEEGVMQSLLHVTVTESLTGCSPVTTCATWFSGTYSLTERCTQPF